MNEWKNFDERDDTAPLIAGGQGRTSGELWDAAWTIGAVWAVGTVLALAFVIVQQICSR